MVKELTKQQKAFLEHLFAEGVNGDFKRAAILAGYRPDDVPSIIRSLRDELVEAARDYIAMHSVQAAFELVGVVSNPTQLGAKEKIKALENILNRVGVKEKEVVEHKHTGGIVVLPGKE